MAGAAQQLVEFAQGEHGDQDREDDAALGPKKPQDTPKTTSQRSTVLMMRLARVGIRWWGWAPV